MSKLLIQIESDISQKQLESKVRIEQDEKEQQVQDLMLLMRGAMAGAEALKMTITFADAAATGSIEVIDELVAGDEITIGSTVLEADVDFALDTDLDVQAELIALAINAAQSEVIAIAAGPVVSLEARDAGTAGNSIALAESTAGARLDISGASLSGGTDQTKLLKFNLA